MSYVYEIVGGKERELSLYFMLNALLQSRIEIDAETTDDEDVNVYLASLLHSRLDNSSENDRLSSYDFDIARMAEKSNPRDRYRLYRSNADQAMVAASVFGRPWFDRRSKPIRPKVTEIASFPEASATTRLRRRSSRS
jgi:hypothetical protein